MTGEVSGSITMPLDETDYAYPAIKLTRVQMWAGLEDVASRIHP